MTLEGQGHAEDDFRGSYSPARAIGKLLPFESCVHNNVGPDDARNNCYVDDGIDYDQHFLDATCFNYGIRARPHNHDVNPTQRNHYVHDAQHNRRVHRRADDYHHDNDGTRKLSRDRQADP